MIALQDVTQETGISYHTLVKYTGLGLIPKSQRVWRGRKGSESWYQDNIIDSISHIKQEQRSGSTLRQIAENRRVGRAMEVFTEVMAMFPGYRFTHGGVIETDEHPDGSIIVKLEMAGERNKHGEGRIIRKGKLRGTGRGL